MRVCDYIADYLYSLGINHVFMGSGGGMMFLSDGIVCHPRLQAVCHHHEQAAAMAAVSYAKIRQGPAACVVTTGCGGTNAVTGVLHAWQDNIPCIFISGQSKTRETIRNSGLPLRQFGVQEADIVAIIEPITKYSAMVNKPEMIAYCLDRALHCATSGRPGPVWIDIPLDVQGASVDADSLLRFRPENHMTVSQHGPTDKEVEDIFVEISASKRPVIIAGQGIKLAQSVTTFRAFTEKYQIPVVSTKLALDVLPNNHSLYIGRLGNKGDRAGNMAVQNADLVFSLGSRLSVSTTGHEYSLFAREARVVVLDIDPVEHKKNTIRIDKFVHGDVAAFLSKALQLPYFVVEKSWRDKCLDWKKKYPVCLPEYSSSQTEINLYYFVRCLSEVLRKDSVVVTDAGFVSYAVHQALYIRHDQRFVTSGGQGEMGYALPAAIGISYALNGGECVAVTGDGSFQLNIQELQTIIHHNLPVKIFVCNNDGYSSIRNMQVRFFNGRLIGADRQSGLSFPEIAKIANAYGLPYMRLASNETLEDDIRSVMDTAGPVLCEVICMSDQEIAPTVSSAKKSDGALVSKPLEDMYPFLDRDTFFKEMIVKPLEE